MQMQKQFHILVSSKISQRNNTVVADCELKLALDLCDVIINTDRLRYLWSQGYHTNAGPCAPAPYAHIS